MSEKAKLRARAQRAEERLREVGISLKQATAIMEYIDTRHAVEEYIKAERQRRFFESLDNDPAFWQT